MNLSVLYRLALLGIVVGIGAAWISAPKAVTEIAPPANAPTMVPVTPANVRGEGVPIDWALVRNGRGLEYWAAPEVWHAMERK